MDIQDDPKYKELLLAVEQTEKDLEDSLDSDFESQKRRLHVWRLADLADFLYLNGLFNEALTYYNNALKHDCDEPSVLNQAGVCFIHIGKVHRALYYFDLMSRRVDSFKDKALAWYNLSACHRLLQDINESIIAIRKSLKFVPNEEIERELNKLKDLNSRKQLLKLKNNLFSRNLLSKDEFQSEEALQGSKEFSRQ